MTDRQEKTRRIAKLRKRIESIEDAIDEAAGAIGVKSVTVDGQSTVFDHGIATQQLYAARKEMHRLLNGRTATIRLDGAG